MKKILLLTGILCLLYACTYAQDPKRLRCTYLKINPTTLINELDILLEQDISDKLSIELGVIGIYTDYPDYVLTKKVNIGQKKPDVSTEQFVDGRGLGFRVGVRYYLITKEIGPATAAGTYFEPVLVYKKVFYPNEDVVINNNTYTNSATKDVYALQLLVGRQFRKHKLVMDPYFGVGIRGKLYRTNIYEGDNNGIANLNKANVVTVWPSLHLGIKLGLNLHK
ncbi:hypothetical protein [Chitinophaga flava]|uniref:Outer membrane protein beta-barrel domain-containing protein n=1 Tax=Chitinophaga flava TaxID=2259036 RepID=A0A365Y3V6_9BACT|nr:hypothetical protein [Chitinophaga flava]RBL93263.1 hypothetical protein DF182_12065 [Chitinophaga flava]